MDGHCPDECEYNFKRESGFMQFSKNKVDSITEQEAFLRKQMDRWINMEVNELGGRIPVEVAKTDDGKKEIERLFPVNKVPVYLPIKHLFKKLDIITDKSYPEREDYEVIAKEYLNTFISEEWEELYKLTSLSIENDFIAEFEEHITTDKTMLKFKTFSLVASALSETHNEALVQFDVNNKIDFTLYLVLNRGKWYVKARIMGDMKLVYAESDTIRIVAQHMNPEQLGNAYEYMKKYEKTYPDSPDVAYYWGLYYTLSGMNDKAKHFFVKAIKLDRTFVNARYNYGFILQAENKLDDAKDVYLEILKFNPKEIKTLNNLAIIALARNDYDEAEKYLRRCLKHQPDFEYAKKNLELIESLRKGEK